MSAKLSQPFQRQRELRTSLAVNNLMHFVNDNPSDIFQVLANHAAWKNCLHRLWRCDEKLRWKFCLQSSLMLRRVAVTNAYLNSDFIAPPHQSVEQISVEAFQRRDVEYAY